MNKLSKREKVLVYIMVCVIIAFSVGFLLVIPQKNRYDDMKEQYDAAKMEKQALQYEVNQVEENESKLEAVNSKRAEAEKLISEPMSPEDIGTMITTSMTKYSLAPMSLIIAPVEEEKTDSTATESETATDESTSADSQTDTVADTEEQTAEGTSSTEKSAVTKIAITAQADGDIGGINLFVGEISDNQKLSIKSLNIDKTATGYSVKITIEMIMPGDLS